MKLTPGQMELAIAIANGGGKVCTRIRQTVCLTCGVVIDPEDPHAWSADTHGELCGNIRYGWRWVR